MIAAARALEYIDLARRSDVYHALRAVMVTRQRDIDWFDQAFREFWRRPSEGYTTLDLHSMGEQRYKRKTQFLPPTGSDPDDGDEAGKPAVDPMLIAIVPTYSSQAALRSKDFAADDRRRTRCGKGESWHSFRVRLGCGARGATDAAKARCSICAAPSARICAMRANPSSSRRASVCSSRVRWC